MKIIQITDTHIGAPDERICGLSPIERLTACVADIETNHSDAAFCVFTGDLSDAGKPAAYNVLSEILSPLSPPVILLPGNHDHREHLCEAFPELQRDHNGFVQNHLRRDEGDFIFLDTLDQGRDSGLYCSARRDWLRRSLDQTQGRPVYLFMHHPPFDVALPSLDALGLDEKEAFAELLSGFDNIRHLFFGHVHRPIAGSWQNISFTTLRGTNHSVPLDFTTTGYVPRSYEPPSYAVVLIDDDKVLVHLHDFLDDTKIIRNSDDLWVCAKDGKDVDLTP